MVVATSCFVLAQHLMQKRYMSNTDDPLKIPISVNEGDGTVHQHVRGVLIQNVLDIMDVLKRAICLTLALLAPDIPGIVCATARSPICRRGVAFGCWNILK